MQERKPRKPIRQRIPMEEGIVSFKVAKLAKKKGCNIKTIIVYDAEGNLTLDIGVNNENVGTNNEMYYAHTQSLLQKWLRDIHHIQLEPQVRQIRHDVFIYKVWIYSNLVQEGDEGENDKVFNTYEDALEDALYESLLLINNNK